MSASAFQRPTPRQVASCALFILVLGGGFGFAEVILGAAATGVDVHIPQQKPLRLTAPVWTEAKALGQQEHPPLQVKVGELPPTSTCPPIKLGMSSPSLLVEPGRLLRVQLGYPPPQTACSPIDLGMSVPPLLVEPGRPLRVKVGYPPMASSGLPFQIVMRSSLGLLAGKTAPVQACAVQCTAADELARMMAAARDPIIPQGEKAFSPVLHLTKEPLAIRSRMGVNNIKPFIQKLPDVRKVILRRDSNDYSKKLEQRLVAGLFDQAEHDGRTTLNHAIKKELLTVVAHGDSIEDAFRAFSILLASSEGTNDLERGQALLTWTKGEGTAHDLTRLSYFTALHHYRSFQYAAGLACISSHLTGKAADEAWDGKDQFLMLKALCAWGEGNDGTATLAIIDDLIQKCPASPLIPHAIFLQAWVHLYCGRTREARAGFGEVVSKHPQSEFAERARQVLQGLPTDE